LAFGFKSVKTVDHGGMGLFWFHLQVRGIPELEPQIMDKLFWGAADSLVLSPLRPEEAQARAWRARVAQAAAVATAHLREYLATYEAFLPLLRVDVKEYLHEAADGTASLADMVEEVRAHSQSLRSLRDGECRRPAGYPRNRSWRCLVCASTN
jgi:hypothetical protein